MSIAIIHSELPARCTIENNIYLFIFTLLICIIPEQLAEQPIVELVRGLYLSFFLHSHLPSVAEKKSGRIGHPLTF